MNKAQQREIKKLKAVFGSNVSTDEANSRQEVAVFFPRFNKTLSAQIDQNGDALTFGIAVELRPFFLDREDMLESIKPEYLNGFVDQLNQERPS